MGETLATFLVTLKPERINFNKVHQYQIHFWWYCIYYINTIIDHIIEQHDLLNQCVPHHLLEWHVFKYGNGIVNFRYIIFKTIIKNVHFFKFSWLTTCESFKVTGFLYTQQSYSTYFWFEHPISSNDSWNNWKHVLAFPSNSQ